ncbi:MAG TPA: zf-HC2 domain-containing protein [Ktedonobacterales bacterium]
MSAETTMRCEDVAPYLSAFADGELSEPLWSEVAEHVASCEACSATLARYAAIDTLLADLPRSAPSPEMLDEILLAVAAEDEQMERRRAVQPAWKLTSFKHKLTELDMPAGDRSSPRYIRPTQRSRWISVALPAIAALLLVSVTLVTFHWLPSKDIVFSPTNQSTPTPAPGAETLAHTQVLVDAIKAQLSFRPILPSYLPDGATLTHVNIGPPDSEIDEHVLDIVWSIGSPANTIHLHEAPARIGLPDYADFSTTSAAAWQIGNSPWRPIRRNDAPKNLAFGQIRAGMVVALDMSVPANGAQAAVGKTTLRLISLSMDAPYKAMPVAPGETTARILPLSIQDKVAHYTAVALNSDGSVAWREEVYRAPCASTADPCQVRTIYALGSNGPTIYTDIASGQRLLHLNDVDSTFSWLPLLPAEQSQDLNNTSLPQLFYLANTYLNTGILWYVGETNYAKGHRVYDLVWTNAPKRTHIYVDVVSHQVVAMVVDARASIQKGGPIAGTGPLSCLRYTMVEYLTSDTSTDALLAQTIPTDYTESTQSQDTQQFLSC